MHRVMGEGTKHLFFPMRVCHQQIRSAGRDTGPSHAPTGDVQWITDIDCNCHLQMIHTRLERFNGEVPPTPYASSKCPDPVSRTIILYLTEK